MNDSWLKGPITLPATVNEDLSTKPSVQEQFRNLFNLSGPLKTPRMKRHYLNFYANLIKASDAYLVDVLDALTDTGLLDDTVVIRTADHGEMGLAHGGQRQKNFNFYEEAIRVPLVYSNECAEGKSSELCAEGVLGSWHSPGTLTMIRRTDVCLQRAFVSGTARRTADRTAAKEESGHVADAVGLPGPDTAH